MISIFTPEPWEEDAVPGEAINCQKCELCMQRSRMIWGEGNPLAPLLVVLDNPGAREGKDGSAFVCGARQTLQLAAHKAGLNQKDMYVTYILKCQPKRRYDKEKARLSCITYLDDQIRKQKPVLAFCLGNTAVQWFFGDPDKDVKSLRLQWHPVRGMLAYVSYHPLAVRRRPNLLSLFTKDFIEVADRLHEWYHIQ